MIDFLAAFGRVFFRLFEFAREADDRPQARKMLSGCVMALLAALLVLALLALTGW
jgi:hypothetical protein